MAVSYIRIFEFLTLFNKKGTFGTVDSVVHNFCSQKLIEHKQGYSGILEVEFLETETGYRRENGESKSVTSLKLFIFDLSYHF